MRACGGEGSGSRYRSGSAYGKRAVFTLDSNILSVQLASFYEFRERFRDRCLRRNRIGGYHLYTAELRSQSCSLIAIQYLYVRIPIRPLVYQFTPYLLRRTGRLFGYHGYRMCRTHLSTYTASFAILHVHPYGNGFAYDGIRTIEPALKTCSLALLSRDALLVVY